MRKKKTKGKTFLSIGTDLDFDDFEKGARI